MFQAVIGQLDRRNLEEVTSYFFASMNTPIMSPMRHIGSNTFIPTLHPLSLQTRY